MLDPARYFDHAATTPLAPEVRTEMEPFLGLVAGNAHSLHAFGRRVHEAVERARERVASFIGAEDPQQVVFTSGATEACNTVIAAFPEGWISPFEHSAVREPASQRGYQTLSNEELELQAPEVTPELVAVMMVNNEIGACWDARTLPARRRFVDATQALGKIAVDLDGIDYAAFSAHKVYGPQGVGALFTADGSLEPLMVGGDHEQGRRAGTTNVAGVVGFGAACVAAEDRWESDAAHAAELRGILLQELEDVSDWSVNAEGVPHILSISFEGIEGETLVLEADAGGFAVSAGAACSSRSTEPSHVLQALGLSPSRLRGTLRVSFGRANTRESASSLGKLLGRTVKNLRTMH